MGLQKFKIHNVFTFSIYTKANCQIALTKGPFKKYVTRLGGGGLTKKVTNCDTGGGGMSQRVMSLPQKNILSTIASK